MPDRELTTLLREVHDELEETAKVSDEERVLLADLVTDIRSHLGDDADEGQGLSERLGDAVDQFTQTHPTLAFTLRRIMDSLAKMGI